MIGWTPISPKLLVSLEAKVYKDRSLASWSVNDTLFLSMTDALLVELEKLEGSQPGSVC